MKINMWLTRLLEICACIVLLASTLVGGFSLVNFGALPDASLCGGQAPVCCKVFPQNCPATQQCIDIECDVFLARNCPDNPVFIIQNAATYDHVICLGGLEGKTKQKNKAPKLCNYTRVCYYDPLNPECIWDDFLGAFFCPPQDGLQDPVPNVVPQEELDGLTCPLPDLADNLHYKLGPLGLAFLSLLMVCVPVRWNTPDRRD